MWSLGEEGVGDGLDAGKGIGEREGYSSIWELLSAAQSMGRASSPSIASGAPTIDCLESGNVITTHTTGIQVLTWLVHIQKPPIYRPAWNGRRRGAKHAPLDEGRSAKLPKLGEAISNIASDNQVWASQLNTETHEVNVYPNF